MAADEEGSGNEPVRVTVATLRGDMQKGFAELGGKIDLLAQTMAGVTPKVDGLEDRVAALELWRAAQEAKPQGLTWKSLVGDLRNWLALIAAAYLVWSQTKNRGG